MASNFSPPSTELVKNAGLSAPLKRYKTFSAAILIWRKISKVSSLSYINSFAGSSALLRQSQKEPYA